MEFPGYSGLELDILKLVDALVILIPAMPVMFKEWSYVGFGVLLLSASLVHFLIDGWPKGIAPLVPFSILSVSYYCF